MGELTGRDNPPHNMTNKLMLAALFVAIAAASASDLEPTASDIVPEADFVATEVGVGRWTDCKMSKKDPACGAPSIYTSSRVCTGPKKVDCQYKVLWTSEKGYSTHTKCSKWNPKGCDKWSGRFNQGASVSARDPNWSKTPYCHEITNEAKGVCRCAGKNQNWKGEGKACFQGPNPPTTKVCRVYKKSPKGYGGKLRYKPMPGADTSLGKYPWTPGKLCKNEVYKQGPWTPAEKIMGACNDQGYAYARTCAYPPGVKRVVKKKAPACVCKVKGYNKSWTLNGKKAGTRFSWYQKGRGHNVKSFHEIACSGCVVVSLHDNDGKRWKDNVHLNCCKGCKYVANKKSRGGFNGKKAADTWDLHDDVSAIDLYKTLKHGKTTHKC